MENIAKIQGYFADIQITKEHNGYYYSVWETLTVVILGSLCGLPNVSQINQWSEDRRVRNFLLKLIEPVLLNRSLTRWAQSMLPGGTKGLTISCDGKTIRSTAKMDKYQSPLHIISAHVAELGITLASQKLRGKATKYLYRASCWKFYRLKAA